jgi:hypothetical protein
MNLVRLLLLSVAVAALVACGVAPAPAPAAAEPAAAPAVAVPAGLTEAQVMAAVQAVEEASKAYDADAFALTVFDDVRFTQMPMDGQEQPQVAGKDAALAVIRAQATEPGTRKYSSQVGAVRLAADGASAEVPVAVTTEWEVDGQVAVATADQVYTVALRDGEVKVAAVVSTTTGLTVDGVKRY